MSDTRSSLHRAPERNRTHGPIWLHWLFCLLCQIRCLPVLFCCPSLTLPFFIYAHLVHVSCLADLNNVGTTTTSQAHEVTTLALVCVQPTGHAQFAQSVVHRLIYNYIQLCRIRAVCQPLIVRQRVTGEIAVLVLAICCICVHDLGFDALCGSSSSTARLIPITLACHVNHQH